MTAISIAIVPEIGRIVNVSKYHVITIKVANMIVVVNKVRLYAASTRDKTEFKLSHTE